MRMVHQKLKDGEFFASQIDPVPINADRVLHPVQLDPLETNPGVRFTCCIRIRFQCHGLAQLNPDASAKLVDVERLGHIIIGALLQEADGPGLILDGRKDDERHRRHASNGLEDAVPGDYRKHHIQKDQVGFLLLEASKASPPVVTWMIR